MSDWVPTLEEIRDCAVASAGTSEDADLSRQEEIELEAYMQDCIYDGLLVALVEMQEHITGKTRMDDDYKMYDVARAFLKERGLEKNSS